MRAESPTQNHAHLHGYSSHTYKPGYHFPQHRLRGMDGSGFQPSIFFIRFPRPMAWAGMVPGRCPSNTVIQNHTHAGIQTPTENLRPPSRGFRTLPGIPIPIHFPGANTTTPHTGARPKRIYFPGANTGTPGKNHSPSANTGASPGKNHSPGAKTGASPGKNHSPSAKGATHTSPGYRPGTTKQPP